MEVDFPAAQTCCAQPMVNTGYLDEAVPVVRTFVDAFKGYDAVVVPSGSCAGCARHQRGMVARRVGDPGLEAAVAEVSPKIYELTEFLVDVLGVTDVGAYYPHVVTYHPTGHSLRMLGVGDRPRQLLEYVRGRLRGRRDRVAGRGGVRGNGHMCLMLLEVLVTLVGIEKVVGTCDGLDPLLRLLPGRRPASG